MKKILFLLPAFGLLSCTSDSTYVQRHQWKYGDGYRIGDWLSFDSSGSYAVSNDTLYKQGKAVAIVIDVDMGIVHDTELEIKSVSTGEAGFYHEK